MTQESLLERPGLSEEERTKRLRRAAEREVAKGIIEGQAMKNLRKWEQRHNVGTMVNVDDLKPKKTWLEEQLAAGLPLHSEGEDEDDEEYTASSSGDEQSDSEHYVDDWDGEDENNWDGRYDENDGYGEQGDGCPLFGTECDGCSGCQDDWSPDDDAAMAAEEGFEESQYNDAWFDRDGGADGEDDDDANEEDDGEEGYACGRNGPDCDGCDNCRDLWEDNGCLGDNCQNCEHGWGDDEDDEDEDGGWSSEGDGSDSDEEEDGWQGDVDNDGDGEEDGAAGDGGDGEE